MERKGKGSKHGMDGRLPNGRRYRYVRIVKGKQGGQEGGRERGMKIGIGGGGGSLLTNGKISMD
jgi:hypothetical protein